MTGVMTDADYVCMCQVKPYSVLVNEVNCLPSDPVVFH